MGEAVIQRTTKLKAWMQMKGWERKDLYEAILKKYPEDPVSQKQLTQIIHGQTANITAFTLYRIMNATGLTPNEILHWEENIIPD